jgi:hypothetical protein
MELLLLLMNDVIADKLDMNDPDAVTIEELSLIEKLENALRTVASSEQDFFGVKTGNVYH